MIALPSENDVIAGKYRVERIIGRGGMGIVVAAWHLELDQRVALKFLLPELVERGDAAERFRREARAAARIKSEHVVRVLDVGNWEGNAPYMVMEYLDGRDLSAELRERGRIPVQDCVDYVLQAIEAVAEAHALNIVHRDLKPENLFLARRVDGGRTVKVLDFGISKTMIIGGSAEQSLTQTSTIMGSPFYMSPEQMRTPRNVDVRSDIWALGAILYDLLCGQPPFVAETIPQLCTMMLESEPLPIRGLRPEVTAELEAVIMRCLAKDLSKRWSSVADVGQALLRFASRSSKIHVERAGRVLSASGAASVPVESTTHSSDAAPMMTTAGLGGGTPTQASQASIVPAEPPSSTQDSWGRTGPRAASKANNGSMSARPAWQKVALAGGAILLAAAGYAIVTKSGSHSSADAPPSAPVVLAPAEPARPAMEPPAAPPAPIQPTHPVPEADPSSAAAARPGLSAAPAESAKPPPIGEIGGPRKTPSRSQVPPAKPTSSGLTDFGGRR
jgi:serine/threonine-protein kinase